MYTAKIIGLRDVVAQVDVIDRKVPILGTARQETYRYRGARYG